MYACFAPALFSVYIRYKYLVTVHPSWKIRRACPRRRHRRQFWLCLCLGSIGAGVESRGRAWCGTHPFRAQHVPNRVTRSRPVLNGVTTPTPYPATASPPGPGTGRNPPNRRFAPSTRRAMLTPVDSRLYRIAHVPSGRLEWGHNTTVRARAPAPLQVWYPWDGLQPLVWCAGANLSTPGPGPRTVFCPFSPNLCADAGSRGTPRTVPGAPTRSGADSGLV